MVLEVGAEEEEEEAVAAWRPVRDEITVVLCVQLGWRG